MTYWSQLKEAEPGFELRTLRSPLKWSLPCMMTRYSPSGGAPAATLPAHVPWAAAARPSLGCVFLLDASVSGRIGCSATEDPGGSLVCLGCPWAGGLAEACSAALASPHCTTWTVAHGSVCCWLLVGWGLGSASYSCLIPHHLNPSVSFPRLAPSLSAWAGGLPCSHTDLHPGVVG